MRGTGKGQRRKNCCPSKYVAGALLAGHSCPGQGNVSAAAVGVHRAARWWLLNGAEGLILSTPLLLCHPLSVLSRLV